MSPGRNVGARVGAGVASTTATLAAPAVISPNAFALRTIRYRPIAAVPAATLTAYEPPTATDPTAATPFTGAVPFSDQYTT